MWGQLGRIHLLRTPTRHLDLILHIPSSKKSSLTTHPKQVMSTCHEPHTPRALPLTGLCNAWDRTSLGISWVH